MLLGLAIIAAAEAISAQGDGAFMSSGFVKALLAGLAALGVGGGGYFAGRKRKVTLDPPDIKATIRRDLSEMFATKDDINELKDSVRQLESRIDQRIKIHEESNARNFEAMYGRLNRNDRETSEMVGLMKSVSADVGMIKQKLFRTGNR